MLDAVLAHPDSQTTRATPSIAYLRRNVRNVGADRRLKADTSPESVPRKSPVDVLNVTKAVVNVIARGRRMCFATAPLCRVGQVIEPSLRRAEVVSSDFDRDQPRRRRKMPRFGSGGQSD